MDRFRSRLVRGAAAAGVSIFLVAGAAFAANALMAPPSAARDFVAAAASSPFGASKVAEPTETAERTETADSTSGTAEPNEKGEPTRSPKEANEDERTETADSTTGTAEPPRSPKATETPEPTETPDVEDGSGDADEQLGDTNGRDQRSGAGAAPTAGTGSRGATATPEATGSRRRGGDGSDSGGND